MGAYKRKVIFFQYVDIILIGIGGGGGYSYYFYKTVNKAQIEEDLDNKMNHANKARYVITR